MNVSCCFFLLFCLFLFVFISAMIELRMGGCGNPDKGTKTSLGVKEGFREEVRSELSPEVEGQGS